MISKYRNRGIVFSVLALAMTVLFVVALGKSVGIREEWQDYLIPLYLCAGVLWAVSSYTLAKAKGYDADALGRVLLLSLLLGFCCQPVALIFPFLGFFLEDKTRSGRPSHRGRHARDRGVVGGPHRRPLRPRQHARRATLFLSMGAGFAVVPAVGMYYDTNGSMALLWIVLLLATFPAVGWGASHLAQSRGYSSGGGCGLCIIAYIVSAFLGTTSTHPLALGVGVLFIVLLPTVVLLSLPNKCGHPHSRR